ncbi:MAG TPA: amidohydrolase family protein [Planctomycetota bacterium]|nr:amidohydrolase family protein [Planctomycetota bacterium]
MNGPFAVIDAHIHIQPWKMIKAEHLALMQGKRDDVSALAELMYAPDKLLAHLDKERIEKVVSINYVSPEIMGFTEEVNQYAARYAKNCGGRLIPFGSVHPTRTEDAKRDMDVLIALGLRGVKIHPAHQPCYPNDYRNGNEKLEIIYKRCEEAGLVLMIHTGTSIFPGARNVYADPIYCDDIGVDFPKLNVILAHGGRPLWMEKAMFVVRRHPNFWMDLSSVPPQLLPEYFPKLETIVDKVLWGSDWPAPGVPGMRANVDRFLTLAYPDEFKRKVVYDNAKRLYRL